MVRILSGCLALWPKSWRSCCISLIRCICRVLRTMGIPCCNYLTLSSSWPVILDSSFCVIYSTALCFHTCAPFWRNLLFLVLLFYLLFDILLGDCFLAGNLLELKWLCKCRLSNEELLLIWLGLFYLSCYGTYLFFFFSTIIYNYCNFIITYF